MIPKLKKNANNRRDRNACKSIIIRKSKYLKKENSSIILIKCVKEIKEIFKNSFYSE